ncbi:CRISPR-associated endonuclease Cas3'', partial [Deinococcus arenicola]
MTTPEPALSSQSPSAAVQVLWAKSGQKSAGVGWLPVLHHLLDVGVCAGAILDREPQATRELLAQDFGTDVHTAQRWTCALAALHDLGKASPAFQHKDEALAARVWAELPWQDHSPDTPHGMVTQKVLPGLLTRRDWRSDVAEGVAGAIGCHHGQREATGTYSAHDRGTGPEWDAVQDELLTLVLRGFGLEDAPPPPVTAWTGEAFMRLAGLTSFADWVGSSFEVVPKPEPLAFTDPAAYVQKTGERAETALDDIGW